MTIAQTEYKRHGFVPAELLVDICPICGEAELVGEGKIDYHIYYKDGYFSYADAGNEPIIDYWYCSSCGASFTMADVEKQAKRMAGMTAEELEKMHDL